MTNNDSFFLSWKEIQSLKSLITRKEGVRTTFGLKELKMLTWLGLSSISRNLNDISGCKKYKKNIYSSKEWPSNLRGTLGGSFENLTLSSDRAGLKTPSSLFKGKKDAT